ncbi:hypothetical protein CRUP_010207 [Coryphaenoides rupestris]|nr:hypothetical protein CRUP_010207 [Coryphaenoides rupestris]
MENLQGRPGRDQVQSSGSELRFRAQEENSSKNRAAHPMMRLSEYSFLLENDSARLKNPRAGTAARGPGGTVGGATATRPGACCWGPRPIKSPHDDDDDREESADFSSREPGQRSTQVYRVFWGPKT